MSFRSTSMNCAAFIRDRPTRETFYVISHDISRFHFLYIEYNVTLSLFIILLYLICILVQYAQYVF